MKKNKNKINNQDSFEEETKNYKSLEDLLDNNDDEKLEEDTDLNNSPSFFKICKKIFIIIILLIIFIRFYGVSQIVTKEYSIIDEEVPTGFDGMKIVQISDIHYGTTINEKMLKKLVTKVNLLKPDIIVFTGDLVDKSINTTDKIKAEISVNLSNLEANIGKYAIASSDDLENNSFNDVMANSGFTVLNDSYQLVYNNDEEPIELVGLINTQNDIELTANYKIALIHEPDEADNLKDKNYNLILAAHSHGGSIRLPFIGGLINFKGAQKYRNDHYKIDDTDLYISYGLGTSYVNFRFFNQPSINLYRFYKE